VSESQRKRSMFSTGTLSQIESLVAEGLSAKEIADRIGCKLGTLRVKCSQFRISLRRSVSTKTKDNCARRLVITLAEETAFDLELHAAKKGMSRTNLAAALLEAIARDNLYNAVIDHDAKPTRTTHRSATGGE
jgi:hypothetical protein